MTLAPAPPVNTPEWLLWRRGGLGASDIPTIVGVNPYQGEYELALEKRGQTEPRGETAATRMGHRMERVGIDIYEELTGLGVVTDEPEFTDPRWPHLWATLDGSTIEEGRAIGVEIKFTNRWDALPRRVEVQALAQIGLAHLDRVDVVRLSAYGVPEVFRVERDDDAITALLDLAERWYVRYCTGDELPPVDGSQAASRHLDRLRGTVESQATPMQASLMADLRRVRQASEGLEAEDRRLVNDLKATMAGTGTLVGEGFRVNWVPVKGRTTVGWESIAKAYRRLLETARDIHPMADADWDDWGANVRPEALDAIESLHTKTGKPGNQFRPTWSDEEETV